MLQNNFLQDDGVGLASNGSSINIHFKILLQSQIDPEYKHWCSFTICALQLNPLVTVLESVEYHEASLKFKDQFRAISDVIYQEKSNWLL